MFKILIFFLLTVILMSCSKQELPKYKSADAVCFYRNATGETDSLSYSFATTGLGKQVDTLFLRMRVIGKVESYDRPLKLRAITGSNARAGVDYKLVNFSVPAGASSFLYPLVLYKTPEMKTQTLRLVLEVEPSEGFTGVVPEGLVLGSSASLNTVSLRRMKIDIADRLLKPAFWNGTTDSYFGEYSDIRYTFMIKLLGTGDLRLVSQGGVWTVGEYNLAVIRLQNELIKYEAANGPLIDEKGNRVEF